MFTPIEKLAPYTRAPSNCFTDWRTSFSLLFQPVVPSTIGTPARTLASMFRCTASPTEKSTTTSSPFNLDESWPALDSASFDVTMHAISSPAFLAFDATSWPIAPFPIKAIFISNMNLGPGTAGVPACLLPTRTQFGRGRARTPAVPGLSSHLISFAQVGRIDRPPSQVHASKCIHDRYARPISIRAQAKLPAPNLINTGCQS